MSIWVFLGSLFSDPRTAPVFDLELSISSNESSEKIPVVPVVIFIPCRTLLPFQRFSFISICVYNTTSERNNGTSSCFPQL